MKIWILNHYASPPDRPAGTRHYEFGRILAEQGHDVTIFASSFSHFSLMEERLAENERMRVENVDGVRFVWIRTVPYLRNDNGRVRNMMSYAFGVILAQRCFARPDVVVGSSVHLAAVAAAYLISKARRVPFVFEVRDLWPQTLIDMGDLREGSVTTRLLRMLERFFYRRARMVISLLPHATEYITRLGIPKEKVVYIPNGIADFTGAVAVTNGSASELVARIRQLRDEGRMVAGYVGSHVRANRVDVLVEAARVLRDRDVDDIAFVIVGEGLEKDECERIAREHKLANILFWPAVPKEAVPAVLEAVDVTLFALWDIPVFKFGLSCNKLFDYLASGRPVVSACAVADTPVSASGGGISVPPESPNAIADALVGLAALGAAGRSAIGERGRRWVYENHGATGLAGQFLQALGRTQR